MIKKLIFYLILLVIGRLARLMVDVVNNGFFGYATVDFRGKLLLSDFLFGGKQYFADDGVDVRWKVFDTFG